MTKIITTLPDPPWDDSVTHNLEIRDMTPHEKAKELIEKFKEAAKNQIFAHWDYYHKRCALMTVDEIIIVIDNSNRIKSHYWQEVKKEIEKL